LAALAISTLLFNTSVSEAASASEAAWASDNVIVAKSGTAVVLLWDASSAVGSMLRQNVGNDAILRAVERESISIVISKAAAFPKARTIEVRVIYARTGAVSPIYGTPDFVSFERLVTVKVAASALRKRKNNRAFHVMVTGKLPTPH